MVCSVVALLLVITLMFILYVYRRPQLKTKYTVVCARYDKRTDFLNTLSQHFDVKIVQKIHDKPFDKKYVHHTVINKANEATSYLSYIVRCYDDLPENIIFIHDENNLGITTEK